VVNTPLGIQFVDSTNGAVLRTFTGQTQSSVAFSSDGTRALLDLRPPDSTSYWEDYEIWLVDLSGVDTRVSRGDKNGFGWNSFAPSGGSAAVSRYIDSTYQTTVFISPGGTQRAAAPSPWGSGNDCWGTGFLSDALYAERNYNCEVHRILNVADASVALEVSWTQFLKVPGAERAYVAADSYVMFLDTTNLSVLNVTPKPPRAGSYGRFQLLSDGRVLYVSQDYNLVIYDGSTVTQLASNVASSYLDAFNPRALFTSTSAPPNQSWPSSDLNIIGFDGVPVRSFAFRPAAVLTTAFPDVVLTSQQASHLYQVTRLSNLSVIASMQADAVTTSRDGQVIGYVITGAPGGSSAANRVFSMDANTGAATARIDNASLIGSPIGELGHSLLATRSNTSTPYRFQNGLYLLR